MNILLSGCRLIILCMLIVWALGLPKANAQSVYKGLPVFTAPQSTNTSELPTGGTSTFVLTIPLNYYNQGRPNAWVAANGAESMWQANLGPAISEQRAWKMSVTLESEIPGVSATVLIKGSGIFPSGLVALQVSSTVGWTATGHGGIYACYLNWGVPKINSYDAGW